MCLVLPFGTRAEGESIRELDIVVATSTPVRVWGADEILKMSNTACDLARFRSGRAPFLADHRNSIESILGRITKPRFENGERLIATVELADTEQARAYAELVSQGMSSSISVGFSVEKWKREDGDDDKPPTYTALRWTPLEASAVAVPADAGASVTDSRTIRRRVDDMADENQTEAQDAPQGTHAEVGTGATRTRVEPGNAPTVITQSESAADGCLLYTSPSPRD